MKGLIHHIFIMYAIKKCWELECRVQLEGIAFWRHELEAYIWYHISQSPASPPCPGCCFPLPYFCAILQKNLEIMWATDLGFESFVGELTFVRRQ